MKSSISLLVATALTLMTCGSSQAATKQASAANLDGCISAVHLWSITFKHEIASFMGVSQERMPALFCQRIAEGIRSGRISYSDINRLQLDQPTEIWLVIKGKSKAAAAATTAPRNSKFRTCSNVITGSFEVAASEKCPLGGSYSQAAGVPTVIEDRPKAAPSAPRNPKFRTCNGTTGTFQIPVSRKCPLSGYAND
ncbi:MULTISPECIES: hypothetical protein [unclassified Mesorhizobium]|uniref:hypothetical protein n=1 Tax=unclassified Mesorhizobium TaxID=325217 RepID=UPI001FE13588|nr:MULTISPECIES: hypothetical protein [unclassified Mesorhizobium]WIE92426.1 hypothetical protein P9270_004270 [Mesorhizobium sp. WSM4875]MCT2575865.1 hypothetical protein [Mesorhizobium sp. P13.3]MDF3165201.1 hypothetical protein [Mesorhizobium sp. P16.1]MDF3176835.1 hypothetical protein [Mesorhizobium sp. P17.1]MDF3182113.1 hypothetical protein [Mesorhizobium sp. ICCV3110.1]